VDNAQWPDDGLSYVPLTASGDNGFPQAFRQQIAGIVYRMTLAVIYTDPAYVPSQEYAGTFFDLPDPERGLFLDLRVEREDQPDTDRLIGVRRVVLDMPIPVGPLRFRFSRIKIAQGNLVGPGQSGSELVAEVAVTNA
jgi:hypothetical protein